MNLPHALALGLSVAVDAVAVFTILFSLLAAVLAPRLFANKAGSEPKSLPPVAVLKPLKGDEPELYENLKSFCRLAYPVFQIIFSAADMEDPALKTAERLKKEFPALDIALVVSKELLGPNPKMNNVAAAAPLIKHDLILISDSDVRVSRDFLKRMVLPLENPSVGLVASFYRGLPGPGLWRKMEALSVNAYFLPQAALSAFFGLRFAMGAAVLVRKPILEKIGGFPYLARHLADDFALGEGIKRLGFKIAFSDAIVSCVSADSSAGDYLKHQIRWSHTIRLCRPAGYLGLIFLEGFSLLSLKIIFLGPDRTSLALMGLIVVSKLMAEKRIARAGKPLYCLALIPIAEWLRFTAWALGWGSKTVSWRQERISFPAPSKLPAALSRK